MASRTGGIVGGVVAKRGMGLGIACRFIDTHQSFQTGTDALISASYVGAAFMAISRKAALKLSETLEWCDSGAERFQPFCMPICAPNPDLKGKTDYLSEDWALCKRAIDVGIPIHVDSWPILHHIGEHEFSIDDAFSGRADSALVLVNGNPDNAKKICKGLTANGLTPVLVGANILDDDIRTVLTTADNLPQQILDADEQWRERMIVLDASVEYTPEIMQIICRNCRLTFFGRIKTGKNIFAMALGRDHWKTKVCLKTATEHIAKDLWAAYRAAAGIKPDIDAINPHCEQWVELPVDKTQRLAVAT